MRIVVNIPNGLYEDVSELALIKHVSLDELVRLSLQHFVNGDHVQDDVITIMPNGEVYPVEARNKILKKETEKDYER